MKIKISYEHDGTPLLPFSAYAEVGGRYFSAFDNSFEGAKVALILRIKSAFGANKIDIPPAEEIEIDE